MIAYPKSFKYSDVREAPNAEREAQEFEELKESIEIWQRLTAEVWDLSMSNYYFDTWMWQFKKMPGVLSRLIEVIRDLKKRETADIVEIELRKNLDYLKNSAEMINFAENKVEDALRLIWARRKELK